MLSKDILEKDTYNILTPITCKYCSHYNTYIEFDLELHLYEIHSIRSDYTIKDAIDSGKRLGRQLDEDSIQKLDLEYLGEKTSPKATAYEDIGKVRPWSQRAKNSFTFMPIISADEFFKDDPDKPYSVLRSHSLEQSPCYPIIGMKPAGRHNVLYYSEICRPKFANGSVVASIDLSSIEHHMRCNKGFEVIKGLEYEYKEPDRHKAEILARLEGWLK